MGVRIAEALDAAHAAGVVHGSLKPADVLIGHDGTVKIADLGTATAGLGSLAGPLAVATYDSPEQLQGQAPTARSDLYTLGILLYESLTGVPPFTGTDAVGVTQRKLAENPIPPSVAAPGIPPGFDAIIDRLLDRDPNRRYATGGAAATDLIRLGETAQVQLAEPTVAMPIVPPAPTPMAPVAPPPPEKKRSATGWIIAAIVVLILIVGGLIAYAVTQNGDDKAQLVQVPAVVGTNQPRRGGRAQAGRSEPLHPGRRQRLVCQGDRLRAGAAGRNRGPQGFRRRDQGEHRSDDHDHVEHLVDQHLDVDDHHHDDHHHDDHRAPDDLVHLTPPSRVAPVAAHARRTGLRQDPGATRVSGRHGPGVLLACRA